MKYILVGLIFVTQTISAQKLDKGDKKVIQSLQTSINYLADDKLEGRRTGSAGERLAYEFIQKEFKKIGLQTITTNKTYIQAFDVNEGREFEQKSKLTIGDIAYTPNEHFFPLSFSGNLAETKLINIEKEIAFIDIGALLKENENNPHFDLKDKLISVCTDQASKNRKLVIFRNSSNIKDDLSFDAKDKTMPLPIAAIFVKNQLKEKFDDGLIYATLTINIVSKIKQGHNVIGYINNNAKNTIILGAHYDHLGYGEDHNSLYAGATPMIHNGADDNASGTAALIEMGKWLKNSSYKKYNYLLVSFSGEELGLFGSKYFADHAGFDLKTINYMINMDMVGRLNDSTHGITIGGYGTSPTWGSIIKKEDAYFKLNLDSSGSGPSDHTSFYKKDIPVLFFFTGSHKDYHKPSDDADKINYKGELQILKYIQNIIAQTDKMDKLTFTKTREVSMGKSTFKVSVGIMPDYTFTGNGVRVDGVSENKPAQKAGVIAGDVLMQLGEHKFSDVQSYMGVLNKFEKGQTTELKLMRGKEELVLKLTF